MNLEKIKENFYEHLKMDKYSFLKMAIDEIGNFPSSKYIVISTDKGNIKVIFDNPQNYISNLSNVEKATLIFIEN